MWMVNVIKRIIYLIPFIHFYTKWSDPSETRGYGFCERQHRFCTVCNKKQFRVISNG